MCGNLAASYFGRQIGYLADGGAWNTVFYISAGSMAMVSLCWFLFDASRPIVREEADLVPKSAIRNPQSKIK